MKKIVALLISLIALAFALPAGAATAQNAQVQPDTKAIATAPPTATRFILAAADAKAKPATKAGAAKPAANAKTAAKAKSGKKAAKKGKAKKAAKKPA